MQAARRADTRYMAACSVVYCMLLEITYMQHPAFAVGPGDPMAELVAPLLCLALGVEQQVHGDAVIG